MISTQNLAALPDIDTLKALCQSLAMLDAILCPQRNIRYHYFDVHWNENQSMASVDTGSGDEYYLLFTPDGAILKGFGHESAMTPWLWEPPRLWPGVLDDVPEVFDDFLKEPAFDLEATTFCIWRTKTDSEWKRGNIAFPEDEDDPDGSEDLLLLLDSNPETYREFGEEYFGQTIDLTAVQSVYRHEPLTEEIVTTLNPEMSLALLEEDRLDIGYPSS